MNTFSESFANRLQDIESRAKLAGSNMTQVCKTTGVARATYERWRHRAPQTVAKVDELEAYVQSLEMAAAKQQATERSAA
jgi:precorrin-6x reductase